MELTRKIQETIKNAIEREYGVNHTCRINNDGIYFSFEDGSKLDIKIDVRINMTLKENR